MATTPEPAMAVTLQRSHLCHEATLGEGRPRGFDTRQRGRDTVIVLRWQGVLHAWRNACPHVRGAPMAWRRDAYMDAAGRHIACHAHGALFEPATGLCVQGPCRGERLHRLALQVDECGEVYVSAADDEMNDNEET